ncbi:MAG TPA: hypothetical protein VET84_12130, partial [Stellaceae bacterium]|nr:hypothetical protein [Stellaceae bacterium]
MRRWLSGPVLAAGWIVLCALFIQFFAGWRMVLALPPLSLAVIIIWVVLPALLIWGAMVVRSRAAEFATVSARLADQLDRLYSPSEERDRRAHEALNALRRQAEDLAGAVDQTVQRIEGAADNLGARLNDSMRTVNAAMERAEYARSDLDQAVGPVGRLVETLSAEAAALERAVSRDLDDVTKRLATHVEDVEQAVERAVETGGKRAEARGAEIERNLAQALERVSGNATTEFERATERLTRDATLAAGRIVSEADAVRTALGRGTDDAVAR